MADGIETLIGDHRRCEALFNRMHAGTETESSVVQQIIVELSIHDAVESELLYPLVEDRLPDGNRLAVDSLGEHANMAQTLAEVDRQHADDPRRHELLADLGEDCRRHFAAEEEMLLAPLHRLLAPEELARLDHALARAKPKAPTRPHPHAPRFTVATHLTASILHPIDRLRDALRRRP